MTDITTPQQQHPVPYVQRVAQIICTGLYPEADAAGKRLADFPKATRENLLTIAEAILMETATEAQSAHRFAWWVTARDELDGLAPAQLIIGGPLETADGTPLPVGAHQRVHFLKPWRERLAMLLQILALPEYEVGGLAALAPQRHLSASELKAAMGFESPSQVQGGWLWMTHPDRNNGEPIPVQLVRDEDDGSLWYVPFDETACEFEWSERDPDWQVVSPVPAAASAETEQPDYESAFRPACADMGAIITLLGFDGYPGIDPVLRRITELIAPRSTDAQREGK
ncbi:conserved hypothetical protein [Cupriavidus necator]|uniref:Uncharacterized protein n=1 Tax=Cupriavidus necator TaxID=106590 RepID=A0A1K0JN74_CUPNE|nr:conserved hypothetical protein [Cupriavidus necator]